MPTPNLRTYRDAIDHLVVYADALGQESEQDRARQAVQAAYLDLALEDEWKYLTKHDRLNVSAKYSTGTVTYTASTRTLVFSDGSVPTWARYGRILIGSDTNVYRIAERSDASTCTLETNFAPVDDASEQTFTLYRAVYPLPGDFYRLEEVHDEPTWRTSYVEPSEWVRLERNLPRVGSPFRWTLIGGDDTFGSMALGFYGRIESAQTFDFIYSRTPRRMKYDGYKYYSSEDGSAAINSYTRNDTSVVFDEVSLERDVVNCVLRTAMSSASKPPGGIGSYERYAEQKIITVRDSTSTVTVGSAFEFSKSSAHFTISDPLDLPSYMLEAFWRGCEYQMELRRGGEAENVSLAEALYSKAVKKARARNSMMPPPVSPFEAGWKDPSWVFLTGTITTY